MVHAAHVDLISEAFFPAENGGGDKGVRAGFADLAVAARPIISEAYMVGGLDQLALNCSSRSTSRSASCSSPLYHVPAARELGRGRRWVSPPASDPGAGLSAITSLVRSSAVGWASGEVVGALVVGALVLGVFIGGSSAPEPDGLARAVPSGPVYLGRCGELLHVCRSLWAAFFMSHFFQTAEHHSPVASGTKAVAVDSRSR